MRLSRVFPIQISVSLRFGQIIKLCQTRDRSSCLPELHTWSVVSLALPHVGTLGVHRCTASLSSVSRSSEVSVSVSTDRRQFRGGILGVDLTCEICRASTGEVPGRSLDKGQGHEECDNSAELHLGEC